MGASVEETRFQDEPALRLASGELSATFLPRVGMTGVSLSHRGVEHIAVPGGVPALRKGSTGGIPLLAPWANRLSSRRYRAGRVDVDFTGARVGTDGNGLPIHGLLVGRPGWQVTERAVRRGSAVVRASIEVDASPFPFPHRIELVITARDDGLEVRTTVVPTTRRRVPVVFGWHPYLRLPGIPRSRWHLRLPRRTHLELDSRGIPTGRTTVESAESDQIGRRHFDDLYELGRDRRLALESDARSVELRCGEGYENAQVWVPPRRQFAALEPMVGPTNALVEGTCPLVGLGESYSARFQLCVQDD